MRKPISKHALRRALEKVHEEGVIRFDLPVGNVVDKIWHEIQKETFDSPRKKPVSRDSARVPEIPPIDAVEG